MQMVNKARRERKKICAALGIRMKRYRYVDKMTKAGKRKAYTFPEVGAVEEMARQEMATRKLAVGKR